MPMPPPTRIAPAAPGLSSRGAEKGRPSGPVSVEPRAGLETPRAAAVPGPDGLDQEVKPHPARVARRHRHGERARQERAAAGRAPALRAQHVELPGRGIGAVGVERGEHDVAAGLATRRRPRRHGRRTARGRERSRGLPAVRPAPLPLPLPLRLLVQLLQASRLRAAGPDGEDRPRDGRGAGHRRDARNAVRAPRRCGSRSRPSGRREPVGVLITRSTSASRMKSTTCGEPSAILLIARHRDAHAGDRLRRAPRGDDPEAEVVEARGELRRRRLVVVGDRDEDRALERQRDAGGGLRLARTRSGSRARCPSPRRSTSSRDRGRRRPRRSARTAAPPP